jgi:hypothetical protein
MFGAKKSVFHGALSAEHWKKYVSTLAQPYQMQTGNFFSPSHLRQLGAPYSQNFKILVPLGCPLEKNLWSTS